jgi:hypothetical protein
VDNYNKFCKDKSCSEYIEWDFSFDTNSRPYPCVSCKIIGQSHDIDSYPEDCKHLDEIKKIELKK